MTTDLYVLIWVDHGCYKLRTYVDPDDPRHPVSAPLCAYDPPLSDDHVFNTHEQLLEFIRKPGPDTPIAVRDVIATELLGWEPIPARLYPTETPVCTHEHA